MRAYIDRCIFTCSCISIGIGCCQNKLYLTIQSSISESREGLKCISIYPSKISIQGLDLREYSLVSDVLFGSMINDMDYYLDSEDWISLRF